MKGYQFFLSVILLGFAASAAHALQVKYEGEERDTPIDYTLCLYKRQKDIDPLEWGKFCAVSQSPLSPNEERFNVWEKTKFFWQVKTLQDQIKKSGKADEEMVLTATIWKEREENTGDLIQLAHKEAFPLSKDSLEDAIEALFNGTFVYNAQQQTCEFVF